MSTIDERSIRALVINCNQIRDKSNRCHESEEWETRNHISQINVYNVDLAYPCEIDWLYNATSSAAAAAPREKARERAYPTVYAAKPTGNRASVWKVDRIASRNLDNTRLEFPLASGITNRYNFIVLLVESFPINVACGT